MAILKQSTTYTRMFLMLLSSDHVSPATGKTVTVNLSKAGGSFAAAGGSVTEVANGWYKIALTTTDTNTLGDLAYNCTATGCDNRDFADQVGPAPAEVVTLDAGLLTIKKDTAYTFTFPMFDSTNHQLVTGKTVSVSYTIDGGALSATSNSVVEISGGFYKISLLAAETNGTQISLKMTASGCDDQAVTFFTQA